MEIFFKKLFLKAKWYDCSISDGCNGIGRDGIWRDMMGKDGMGSNGKGRDGMRKDGRDNPPTPLKLNLPLPQLFFRENPPTPLK